MHAGIHAPCRSSIPRRRPRQTAHGHMTMLLALCLTIQAPPTAAKSPHNLVARQREPERELQQKRALFCPQSPSLSAPAHPPRQPGGPPKPQATIAPSAAAAAPGRAREAKPRALNCSILRQARFIPSDFPSDFPSFPPPHATSPAANTTAEQQQQQQQPSEPSAREPREPRQPPQPPPEPKPRSIVLCRDANHGRQPLVVDGRRQQHRTPRADRLHTRGALPRHQQ